MEINVPELRLTARTVLRPGSKFRLKRSRHRTLPLGQFVVRRLFRDSRRPSRLYAEALSLHTGGTYTVYLSGPAYTSPVDGQRHRPERIVPIREATPTRELKYRRRRPATA